MPNSEPRKPRVAVVTPRFPLPLNKGDRLRIHHQLSILHRHFDIDLHCLSFRKVSDSERESMMDRCEHLTVYHLSWFRAIIRMIWAPMSRRPFQVLLFTEKRLIRDMRQRILQRSPDVLLAQMVRTAEYVKDFDAVPHVLDIMDTLHAGAEREAEKAPFWKRPLLLEEGRRLVRYEHRMPNYFDACTIISRQDRDLLPHPDRDAVVIVPNGVNTDFFDPDATVQPLDGDSGPFDVAFCGNLGYAPNVVAARYLVQDIAPAFESLTNRPLKVLLSGAQPAQAVLALAGRHVRVAANVPDIRSAYLAAPLFVAPMLVNTGLQNKLLEAMALRRVCITTPRALSAMGKDPGATVVSAENPADFALQIARWLDDEGRRRQMGREARRWVTSAFDWTTATATLVALLMKHAKKGDSA